MEHSCGTCKFANVDSHYLPCKTCSLIWRSGSADNWQPAKLKRKDLQAQLDAANERLEELERERDKGNLYAGGRIGFTYGLIDHMAEWQPVEKEQAENPVHVTKIVVDDSPLYIGMTPEASKKFDDMKKQLEKANERVAELEERERYRSNLYASGSTANLRSTTWDPVHHWRSEEWEAVAKIPPDIDKTATNSREMRLMNDLADLQKRYDALKDCYLVHEEPGDSAHSMVVDFGKVLVEHEEELTHANAEIESMHRELAAKQGEIDDVWKQLHARDEDIAALTRARDGLRLSVCKWMDIAADKERALAAKQAIIDQQERELAEANKKLSSVREHLHNAEVDSK